MGEKDALIGGVLPGGKSQPFGKMALSWPTARRGGKHTLHSRHAQHSIYAHRSDGESPH